VRLVGYDAPPSLSPGDTAPITLYWQAPLGLDADYVVGLQAQDSHGNVYGETQAPPALGIYPTSHWQPNELVRDPHTIVLRGDTPDGDYALVAKLVNPAQQSTSSSQAIGSITVHGRPHYFGTPTPSQTLDSRFGNVARLAGYDLTSDGSTVRLVLYWQALESTPISYKIFSHVVDSGGNILLQSDQVPGTGMFPTTSWVGGEYVVDVHKMIIPSTFRNTGGYQVRVGMYDPASGLRLSLVDATNKTTGDYLVLPTRMDTSP
jgi:hypothetical protein